MNLFNLKKITDLQTCTYYIQTQNIVDKRKKLHSVQLYTPTHYI